MRWSGSVSQLHRTYSSNSTAPYHGCMLRAFDGFRKLGALSGSPYKKDCVYDGTLTYGNSKLGLARQGTCDREYLTQEVISARFDFPKPRQGVLAWGPHGM